MMMMMSMASVSPDRYGGYAESFASVSSPAGVTAGGARPSRPRADQAVAVSEGTRGRLSELSQRFVSFERQVEADARARRVTEEATLEAVALGVDRLEQSVAEECGKREVCHRQLQANLDERLTAVQRRIESSFLEQFDHVYSLVDALNDRMASVEQSFSQASSKYVREMKDESAAVDTELSELSQAFRADVAARKEREENIAASLEELERRAAAKLERDEQLAGRKFAQLLRDAQESVRGRDEMQQRFQERAEVEIATVKKLLAESIKARVQADDDIVAALDHYTKELQRAVSSVSHGTVQAVLN